MLSWILSTQLKQINKNQKNRMNTMNKIGLVVIGRNEGDRLGQCLQSAQGKVRHIVYVDSGSTDGSQGMAQSLGVKVVELDLSIPFTAARARNAGFDYLLKISPHLEYVQFVDGDCAIVDGWLECAYHNLESNPKIAVVCGRRRERFPEESIYNRLCDLEWNTPVGEAKACGGDAMMRVEALKQVGDFNPSLIAGEEPELCVRIRQQGWKIFRIDAEMTLHDAQMTHFSQWWKRSLRAGYAYAEGAWLHGKPPGRHWVRESRSIWFWGFIVPFFASVPCWFTSGLSLLLLGVYPLLAYKIYRSQVKRGMEAEYSRLYALFCVLGKFAQVRGKGSGLIEYKSVSLAGVNNK